MPSLKFIFPPQWLIILIWIVSLSSKAGFSNNYNESETTLSSSLRKTDFFKKNDIGNKPENDTGSIQKELDFNPIKPFDIVINEIMYDPIPQQELPDAEYIELYNTSDNIIDLTDWRLIIGDKSYLLPQMTIKPGDYLIISTQNTGNKFNGSYQVLDILSHYALKNSGSAIVIKDQQYRVIDSVFYTAGWYQDQERDNGGWSLERIDSKNTCGKTSNWKASVHQAGGTPGYKNANYRKNQDNIPPRLLSCQLLSENQIKLIFNEETEPSLASYSCMAGTKVIKLDSLIHEAQRPNEIILVFQNHFPSAIPLKFTLKNITDPCSNITPTIKYETTWYQARIFDIVISEIMADPNPPVHLPEAEYLEFHNGSDYTIYATNWILNINEKKIELPYFHIPKNEHLVITDMKDTSYFTENSACMGISSFPALPNEGGHIHLMNAKEETIHFVNYQKTWHRDELKAAGGWSLEMIDKNNPCGEQDNWISSNHPNGGTPGQKNESASKNSDKQKPQLLRAGYINPYTLCLYFNETLHPQKKPTLNQVRIIPDKINPLSIHHDPLSFSNLILQLDSPIPKEEIFNITIKKIEDCCGNIQNSDQWTRFARPDAAMANEIIINEILFNENIEGTAFIELYNHSKKVFDLNQYKLLTINQSSQTLSNQVFLSSQSDLLFPGDYVVFTKNKSKLLDYYYCQNPEFIREMSNLPNLPNKSGRVLIFNRSNELIDELNYNASLHFPLLTTQKGVSLERISPEKNSNNTNNWHSAAQTYGFATPGYQNSQFSDKKKENSQECWVTPEVFSPDQDGKDDCLEIHYQFDEPGYIGTILIFDARGRMIRKLVDHQLMGRSGFIKWNGINNNGRKAPIGIYTLLIEVFNKEGVQKRFKKNCVLGGYLKP